jgi:gas vesicle protein
VFWFGALWHWYSANATVINPIGAFVGAVGAFITAMTLAWVGVQNARTAARRHEEQTKADRERRITESFSKATEQLASDKIEARLGGIYTLERISRESRDDYWVVMETLTAFVRERARWKERDKIASETLMSPCDDKNSEDKLQPEPATDIAAVLTVIQRRHLLVGWRISKGPTSRQRISKGPTSRQRISKGPTSQQPKDSRKTRLPKLRATERRFFRRD